MGTKRSDRQELLHGTLDMLILKSLTRGVMHGYGIAEQLSDEVLQVEEGSLYPALQRLQMQGLIASEWGHSVNTLVRQTIVANRPALAVKDLPRVEAGHSVSQPVPAPHSNTGCGS